MRAAGDSLCMLVVALFFVALAATSCMAGVYDPPAEAPSMSAQDASGCVWAITDPVELSSWDASIRMWRKQPFPYAAVPDFATQSGSGEGDQQSPVMYHPISLDRSPMGVVVCLWAARTGRPLVITSHLGDVTKVIGRTSSSPSDSVVNSQRKWGRGTTPLCYMDSRGDTWLTPDYRSLHRLDSAGKMEKVYDLPVAGSWMDKPDNPSPIQIGAVEDSRGRIVFYCQTPLSTMPDALPFSCRMEGIVIEEQGRFSHIPALSGLLNEASKESPPGTIAGIAKLEVRDGKTLWLLPALGPLCVLDLDLGAVTPAPEPEPGVFSSIYTISKVGSGIALRGASGCWMDDGHGWKRLSTARGCVSKEYYPGAAPMAAWAPDAGGLVFAAGSSGFGFTPVDGEARIFDWRSGFTLASVNGVYVMPGGQALLLGVDGAAQANLAALASIPPANPSPESIPIYDMAQTMDKRIWTVRTGADGKWDGLLLAWDGVAWTPYEAPLERSTSPYPILRRDYKERLWVFGCSYTGGDLPVAVFDSVNSKWSRYPSFNAGCEAYKDDMRGFIFNNQPCHRFSEPVQSMGEVMNEPCFSADGKIIIAEYPTGAKYYDGKSWWSLPVGEAIVKEGGQPCGAFFTEDGKAAMIVQTVRRNNDMSRNESHSEVWLMNSPGQWDKSPDMAPLWPINVRRRAFQSEEARHSPFNGADEMNCGIVQDNYSVWWACMRDRKLQRCVSGVYAPGFPEGFANPFVTKRHMQVAFADAVGNTFIQTAQQGSQEVFVIPPAGPMPDTALELTQFVNSQYEFTASSSTPDVFYSWRVDREPWTDATKDPLFKVPALPEGKHRIRVRAIAPNFEFDRSEAEFNFEVGVTDKDITAWVVALGSASYRDREAAACSLREHPDKAVPILESARATADKDKQWWIDGILDGIRQGK